MINIIYTFSGGTHTVNPELWHACAGPLVSLPEVDSIVYFFPKGYLEQMAALTTSVPSYLDLPSQLLCQVKSLTLHVSPSY